MHTAAGLECQRPRGSRWLCIFNILDGVPEHPTGAGTRIKSAYFDAKWEALSLFRASTLGGRTGTIVYYTL